MGAQPADMGLMPSLVLRISNFLGYFLLILVNVLSSMGALGGTNTDVSKKYDTPLTPAGYAFSIWGLIFTLEGAGVIYQVLNAGYRQNSWKKAVVGRIGYTWQCGWMFQNAWQICFVQESVVGMWFAAAALVGALACFSLAHKRLSAPLHGADSRAAAYAAAGPAGLPPLAYVLYKLPTSINTAWLSVATCLGILIVPVAYGVSADALVAPAAVLTVAATAAGLWRLAAARDTAYGLTLIWAFAAVAASGSNPKAVKGVGIGCAAVLALGVVATLVRVQREAKRGPQQQVHADAHVPLGGEEAENEEDAATAAASGGAEGARKRQRLKA